MRVRLWKSMELDLQIEEDFYVQNKGHVIYTSPLFFTIMNVLNSIQIILTQSVVMTPIVIIF